MSAARDTPVVRQWLVLRALGARRVGVSVQELARELAVNEKTIRRDLVTLAGVGFPLAETTIDHGRKLWRLENGAAVPGLSFAVDEALALYLGRRLLEPLAGTFFWQAAQNAFRKIRLSLGKPALDYLDRMAGRLHDTAVGASDYSARAELVDNLVRGIEDRRATLLSYRSLRATEPVEHEVHPLGLIHHRGSLYLVAYSRWHVERCFEDQKNELGFDHFEGRCYLGLKRHQAIAAVAHLFLARVQQELRGKKTGADGLPGADGRRGPGPVVVAAGRRASAAPEGRRQPDRLHPSPQRRRTQEPHQDHPTKTACPRHRRRHTPPLPLEQKLAL
jgi:hypothetical protein